MPRPRFSPPSRRPLRAAAVVLGFALLAVACASADDLGSEVEGGSSGEGAAELFSPTTVEEPFALDGGAETSSVGRLDPSSPDRAPLSDRVAEATAEWETNWSQRTVELDEFLLGLPRSDPRDGIPPIDVPKFEPITEAAWLDDREPGALVELDGELRFYPLSILTRHEIVNDRFGDVPVAVTYCPLCNTAMAFDRRVDGQVLRFGVSGLLRNSDLVMWDDATTSLWQQITGEGVAGDFAGTDLEPISTRIVSYGEARDAFPDAWSLSQDTGFGGDYGRNPYALYSSSPLPFLYDGEPDPRFPALSRVVGVSIDGAQAAYPFETIRDAGAINDEVEDTPVVVMWGGDTADALDTSEISDGEAIGTAVAYDRRVGDETLTFSATSDDQFTDAETGSTWNLLGQATAGPLEGEQLDTVTHRNEFWFAWAAFFPSAPVYTP